MYGFIQKKNRDTNRDRERANERENDAQSNNKPCNCSGYVEI